MKFLLFRTSQHDPAESPLSLLQQSNLRIALKLQRYDYIDVRAFSDPAQFQPTPWNPKPYETWYTEGADHKVVNGEIQRTFFDKEVGWFIEVPDIQFLMRLQSLCGQLIVRTAMGNYLTPAIEIYDEIG